jgi:tRNA A37 threonylcarbamoyladenosine synthetase subunit TsaC/SUA5/YrdC
MMPRKANRLLATGTDTLKAGAAVGMAAKAARTAARRRHGPSSKELEVLAADIQHLLDRVDRWLSLVQRTCPSRRWPQPLAALLRARNAAGRCVFAYTLHLSDPCSLDRASNSQPRHLPPH